MRLRSPLVALTVTLASTLAACGSGGSSPAPQPSVSSSGSPQPQAVGRLQWSSGSAGVSRRSDVEVTSSTIAVAGYWTRRKREGVALLERPGEKVRWFVGAQEEPVHGAGRLATGQDDELAVGTSPDLPVAAKFDTPDGHGQMLVGLRAADGAGVWSWSPGGRGESHLGVLGVVGRLVIARLDTGGPTSFVGIDLATGRERWRRSYAGVDYSAEATLLDGNLVLQDRVVDPATGAVLWRSRRDGRILGMSGDTLLWQPDAVHGYGNRRTPRLIDIDDPTAALPTFPDGFHDVVGGQQGVLEVTTWDTDRHRVVDTFAHGESSLTRFDADGVELGAVAGDARHLYTVQGARLTQWSRSGTAQATMKLPASGFKIQRVDRTDLVLKGSGQWVVVVMRH